MGPHPSRLSDILHDSPWIVVDGEVTARARHYRQSLQTTWNQNSFRDIVEAIRDLYVKFDLKPPKMEKRSHQAITTLLNRAFDEDNVQPVVQAYTTPTNFHRLVNEHLANLVSTDDLLDIRMGAGGHLMSYWCGSLDLACIFVNHPDLDVLRPTANEKVFRGMSVSDEVRQGYRIGTFLMNKTFVSTSKSQNVALLFLGKQPDRVSCLCEYTLRRGSQRTALDIGSLSSLEDEEEVLILPYATFQVIRIQYIGDQSDIIDYLIELREHVEESDDL